MVDRADIPAELNELSERVIGAAIAVHRALGPGLLEPIYGAALCQELSLSGIAFAQQVSHIAEYKGAPLPAQRFDLVIAGQIIVELKSVESVADAHLAQLVSYLRLSSKPLGLLINFNTPIVTKGVYRRINSKALNPS